MIDVAMLDYGTGNLHSLAKALEAAGARVRIESETAKALSADALVLPGVGSFAAAAAQVGPDADALRAALAGGMPGLGICLGMQLLFGASDEGRGEGIGLFAGSVRRLEAPRIPHMGWNEVEPADDPLFANLRSPLAYYANSYAVLPASEGDVVAWTRYAGLRFPAAVHTAATWGLQFHPEKSGTVGLRILSNFVRQVKR
jgi:imidazole glycerol-phosphate synthase subunit HisH